MARKPEVKFFTTGSPHTFHLFLYLSAVTLNFRMHNFFFFISLWKTNEGKVLVTVLGPLLFLLYVNDLPFGLESQTRLFVDDCLVYCRYGQTSIWPKETRTMAEHLGDGNQPWEMFFWFCDEDTKRLLYKILVRLKLECVSLGSWDPHYLCDVNKLENILRAAARFCKGDYKYSSSVTSMIRDLEREPLASRRKQASLILCMHNVHNFKWHHSCKWV